ncbi:MAG: helix-turn-helix transcriptional regulator [Clostridia bacterium]|nr:helix-turn-helix transcriptional regulator [Clostridia bacterium]
MDKEKFGSFIAVLRKESGLTQKELAQKINLTDKAISKWERGLSFPDISMLEPLAETLQVSVLELIKGERLTPESMITNDEAKDLLESSLLLSDEEIERNRLKSRRVIIFFIMLLMLLVSIGLNVYNYLII